MVQSVFISIENGYWMVKDAAGSAECGNKAISMHTIFFNIETLMFYQHKTLVILILQRMCEVLQINACSML